MAGEKESFFLLKAICHRLAYKRNIIDLRFRNSKPYRRGAGRSMEYERKNLCLNRPIPVRMIWID